MRNVSIRRDGGKVVPWSRGGPIGRENRYFFEAFRQYVFDRLAPEIYDLPDHIVPFGEFPHSGYGHIKYDPAYLNTFFLIAAYDANRGSFLPPAESQQILADIGIMQKMRPPQLLRRGTIDQKIAERLVNSSGLHKGPREGIVLHQYGNVYSNGLRMQKYYHPEFKERDPRKEGVEQYTTLRRFIKAGQRLLSTGTEITLDAILTSAAQDIQTEDSLLPAGEIQRVVSTKRALVEKKVLHLFA